MPGVQQFISKEQSQRFIEPPPFDMKQCFGDSKCYTPLIFVLTPGRNADSIIDRYGFSLIKIKIHSLAIHHSPLQYLFTIFSNIVLNAFPVRVFILPGAAPMAELTKLAEEMGFANKLLAISLMSPWLKINFTFNK